MCLFIFLEMEKENSTKKDGESNFMSYNSHFIMESWKS